MHHGDKALEYFMNGYNCAQSTAAPFAEDFNLNPEDVLIMTAGFGGGMGGLREKCGAVSAMVYIAGLHAGPYDPNNLEAKTALYELVRKLNDEFEKEHGTTCCRELLEKASCDVKSDPSERNAEYYAKRPCAKIIKSAAELLSRTLAECSD